MNKLEQLKLNTKINVSNQDMEQSFKILDSKYEDLRKYESKPGKFCGVHELQDLFKWKKGFSYLFTGSPGCFTADQLIHTGHGVRKIAAIKKGDFVLTYNHELNVNQYRKVTETLRKNTNKSRLLKIKMKDGTIIKCTEDHKFFTGTEYLQIKDILLSLLNKKKLKNGILTKS